MLRASSRVRGLVGRAGRRRGGFILLWLQLGGPLVLVTLVRGGCRPGPDSAEVKRVSVEN
jgi:hypothetical protein